MGSTVSLIVLTYNSEKYMGDFIRSLQCQSLKPDELIMIDSSSSDGTVKLGRENGFKVISISVSEFDHGKTRTLGAKSATGDIVIFTTHDIVFNDKNTIRNLVNDFDNEQIGGVYGRQIAAPNANFFAKRLRAFNYPNKRHSVSLDNASNYGFKAIFFSDSFSGYRKSVLEKLNYFKSHIIFGEDSEIASRIIMNGYTIRYNNEACVIHSHNYSIYEEMKRYFDVGVFHSSEAHLLQKWGNPEGEGVRSVLKELKEIFKQRKLYLIFSSIFRNGFKFIGYRLGRKYKSLPKRIILKLTMNRGYWINE